MVLRVDSTRKMATKSSYLRGAFSLNAIDEWEKPAPIPKVIRVDDRQSEIILSDPIKSEWPSVSSKSKKALSAPVKYQFYYGDTKEIQKDRPTKTIRVPIEHSDDLGAWTKGPVGRR